MSDFSLCISNYALLFQSALTGESLPVTKNPGEGVYSGSTCKQGEIQAVVIATGVHTFFGKAAHLVETTTHVGHFQQVHIPKTLNPHNGLKQVVMDFWYVKPLQVLLPLSHWHKFCI